MREPFDHANAPHSRRRTPKQPFPPLGYSDRMVSRVHSFLLGGIDALPCEVEVDLSDSGMNKDHIVGLPDSAVRESLDRVRAAMLNSGYRYPFGSAIVNLAPADVRKEGPVYDLPIAVALLGADRAIDLAAGSSKNGGGDFGVDARQFMFAGELALDGRVRPVKGVIAMAALARSRGLRGIVVPSENAAEAAAVEGIEVFGVRTLSEVVGLLSGLLEMPPVAPVNAAELIERTSVPTDFADVRGQEGAKRALTVAAAGGHNILLLGPPGTGKTMMAKALPGILPPLSPDEALEITRIYSAAGCLPRDDAGRSVGLVTRRPVRSPHHTASAAAVIGGGMIPRPGEISLAHHGILFLDELPEFPRMVLDTLRQPLEDGSVTVSRAHSSVRFPASFMLVAAMNPTAKGTLPDSVAGRREMEKYLSRVSGPLIDRIDIHIEVPPVPWAQLNAGKDAPRGTGTREMRERVAAARAAQHARQGVHPNARLSGRELDAHAPMTEQARAMLGEAMTGYGLSARAFDKIRRVSRTIADLDSSPTITDAHVAEAVQYRLLDRQQG